jgi:hypothetical protein
MLRWFYRQTVTGGQKIWPLIWSGRGNPCRILNHCCPSRIRTQIKQSMGNWRRASWLRALLHCGCLSSCTLKVATWDVTRVANTVTSYVTYLYDHWYLRCCSFISALVQYIRYISLVLALFMRLIWTSLSGTVTIIQSFSHSWNAYVNSCSNFIAPFCLYHAKDLRFTRWEL